MVSKKPIICCDLRNIINISHLLVLSIAMYYIWLLLTKTNHLMINYEKAVLAQEIADFFGVGLSKAKKMAQETREFYNKKRSDSITLAQVKKANNLEA